MQVIFAFVLGFVSITVHALGMSTWSDKTVCRLVKEQGSLEFINEAKSRKLACLQEMKAVNEPVIVQAAVAGIDIENDANIAFFKPPMAPSPTDNLYWFGRLWQIADFNKDGFSDVLYIGTMHPQNTNSTGEDTGGICGGGECKGDMPQPSMFLGSAEGSLTYAPDLIVDKRKVSGMSLGRQVLVADYNNDKVLDFYIADHAVGTHDGIRDSYYLSQPNGTWLESSATHLSHKQFKVFDHGAATGDIDNDGDMDVVITELAVQKSNTAFWCLLNDGSGFLKKRRCGGSFAFGLELADMDQDGDLDALVGAHENNGSKWGFTGIVWNNGRGQFNHKTALPKHVQKWSTIPEVSAADLDNDGDLDVVYSRAGVLYVGTAIQVLENLGNKKFKDHGITPLVQAPADYVPKHEGNEWNDYIEAIMFRDFNGDSLKDIYLASGSNKTNGTILLNNGEFDFTLLRPAQVKNLDLKDSSKAKVVFDDAYLEKLQQPKDTQFSRKFARAYDALQETATPVKYQAFNQPLPLSTSGAVVIGADNIRSSDLSRYLTAKLHLRYGGKDVSVHTCFEYYPQFTFMAVRTRFAEADWGGVGMGKIDGSNFCKDKRGYLGDWEVGTNEAFLKEVGILPVLKDLGGAAYSLLRQLDEKSDLNLSSLLETPLVVAE